jgi:hypothetical protein
MSELKITPAATKLAKYTEALQEYDRKEAETLAMSDRLQLSDLVKWTQEEIYISMKPAEHRSWAMFSCRNTADKIQRIFEAEGYVVTRGEPLPRGTVSVANEQGSFITMCIRDHTFFTIMVGMPSAPLL